jgi:hypothetical protein
MEILVEIFFFLYYAFMDEKNATSCPPYGNILEE